MHIVEWRAALRHIPQAEVDDFYHQPLAAPALFRFTTSKLDMPAHEGAFSLKLVLAGEETYRIGRRSAALRPGDLLFVNAGETYSSRIDGPTTSLSIFLPEGEAREAIASAVSRDEPRIDDPAPPPAETPQIVFSASARTRRALDGLQHALNARNGAASESMRLLLAAALAEVFGAAPPAALRHIKKRATRDELLRRVLAARALIDDSEGQCADLDALAAAACLSKYHFLRVFAEVCGASPGAYARRRRLEAAQRSLARGEERRIVARRAGYSDGRAFGRAVARLRGAMRLN